MDGSSIYLGARPSSGSVAARPRRPGKLSLRWWVTLLVVLPVAVVSVALVLIASATSRSIAEQLGQEIVASATSRVSADVSHYLGGAIRVSDLYAARLRDGALKMNDLAAWEQPMFHDLEANRDVASICYGDIDGNCTWLLHAHQRIELGKVLGDDREHAIEFPADESGQVDRAHPIRVYHYDCTQRPWFKMALASDVPIWTPVYFWFGDAGGASETGTGYVRVIRDALQKPLGVLVVDVTLNALSQRLRQLPVAASGHAFIVDNEGLIVAASSGAVVSPKGTRLRLEESDSEAARAASRLIDGKQRGVAAKAISVRVGGAAARAFVEPLTPYPGLNWQVVTVLPEASFLSSTSSLRDRSALMAGGAIAGGIALGLLLSRRLSRPLLQLTDHVSRIGSGDFDARLHLDGAKEFSHLSDEINRMSGGLRRRLALENSFAVARQVQQSLLPESVPQIDGLEIVAVSRYAESTGGDYYDFIVHDTDAGPELLVAVGDVTGHGIGSALLMATARGAVRAACEKTCPLGDILSHTNRVLASSSTRGMFMTLALVAIDRATLTVRWATAGHDPALVYYPQHDLFKELCTEGIPLGIETTVRYDQQISRCATSGFTIVLGTDGIWEARDANDEMFGKERLRALMTQHHGSAKHLAAAIQSELARFTGTTAVQDDMTIVVIRAT